MSSPSNNLKEQVAKRIYDLLSELGVRIDSEEMTNGAEQEASEILNLTIDTILASEEMQEHPDLSYADKFQNKLRADFRAMLEGLR